jgi:hypothetical protein
MVRNGSQIRNIAAEWRFPQNLFSFQNFHLVFSLEERDVHTEAKTLALLTHLDSCLERSDALALLFFCLFLVSFSFRASQRSWLSFSNAHAITIHNIIRNLW